MAQDEGIRALRNSSGAQLRLEYDASNYIDLTVNSDASALDLQDDAAADVNITGVGTLAASGAVTLPSLTPPASNAIGIGTSDIEAWSSGWRALEWGGVAIMGSTSSGNLHVFGNAYFDGAFKRKVTGAASNMQFQSTGNVKLRVATSAAADAEITWREGINVSESSDAAALGFYGATPVTKQTGVAVSASAIHTALSNLGLIS